ncbi:MAG: prenyltransferase/squalene oxidase repeat-containing protein, partial [Planctomycetota bacterium]
MSIKRDMQRAARLAPSLLREATDGVVEFLLGQFNADGGGKNRSGESDLYYTMFAINGLAALSGAPPTDAIVRYLRGFGEGADLDFIHQACLARCWAAMPKGALDADTACTILRRLETHRSSDGGYSSAPGRRSGTVYNCFLALGAYQDLGRETPDSR